MKKHYLEYTFVGATIWNSLNDLYVWLENMYLVKPFIVFCLDSTSYTNYCEVWSIYILQMSCTEILNQATCSLMQIVTSRFVTLG